MLLVIAVNPELQEQVDNFDGAKVLAAAMLANELGSRAILNHASNHTADYVDPNSADEASVQKLNKAFEARAQQDDPNFSNQNQLRRKKLNKGDKGYPGQMHRYTKDHFPNMKADHLYRVSYAPNLDRAIYAHELGHIVSQNTNTGLAINKLSNQLRNNPTLNTFLEQQASKMPEGIASVLKPYMKSSYAMAAGRLALPAALAAAIPGDDDAAAAVAASLVLATPQLTDEFLASKNALGIMKDAGMPATPRQRMRIACALVSYLAIPLAAALLGNIGGNVA